VLSLSEWVDGLVGTGGGEVGVVLWPAVRRVLELLLVFLCVPILELMTELMRVE
jgi:hypothetical protein